MNRTELSTLHAAKRVLNKHVTEADAYVHEASACVRYTIHVEDRVLQRSLSLAAATQLVSDLEIIV